MSSITRDLGSHDLWERSLERSLRRRALAADGRRQHSRRRRASVAATAAVAAAPIASSVAFASTAGGASGAPTAQSGTNRDSDPVLLEFGSRGPSVRDVQRPLGVVVDGIYGPHTEQAVFTFQQDDGLPATGKVDLRTWSALLRQAPQTGTGPVRAQAGSEPGVRPVALERVSPSATPQATRVTHARTTANASTKRLPAPVRRATTVKPAAARAAATSHSARQAGSASGAPTGGTLGRILSAIASCESGGNPSAVGGGGLYRGLYQFDQQTWDSLGGSGDPASASAAAQTQRAAELYAQRGASAWPTCGPPAAAAASGSSVKAAAAPPQAQAAPATVEARPEVSAAATPPTPVSSAAADPQPARVPTHIAAPASERPAPADSQLRAASAGGSGGPKVRTASASIDRTTERSADRALPSHANVTPARGDAQPSAASPAARQPGHVPAGPQGAASSQAAPSGGAPAVNTAPSPPAPTVPPAATSQPTPGGSPVPAAVATPAGAQAGASGEGTTPASVGQPAPASAEPTPAAPANAAAGASVPSSVGASSAAG